jgi:hypothetical protein
MPARTTSRARNISTIVTRLGQLARVLEDPVPAMSEFPDDRSVHTPGWIRNVAARGGRTSDERAVPAWADQEDIEILEQTRDRHHERGVVVADTARVGGPQRHDHPYDAFVLVDHDGSRVAAFGEGLIDPHHEVAAQIAAQHDRAIRARVLDVEAFRDGREQALGGARLPTTLVNDDGVVLPGGLLNVAPDGRCGNGSDDIAAADVIERRDQRGIEEDLACLDLWVAQSDASNLAISRADAKTGN